MSAPQRVLDWTPNHDPRSRGFAIRTTIGTSVPLRNKTWRLGPTLDQGEEGACVPFGWTGEALSTPVAVDLRQVAKNGGITEPSAFARSIYLRCRQLDEWEGEDYEGTSVNAGAKVMRELGLVKEYRWCFGIRDVRDAVLAQGPVVIGIWWYEGMYEAPGGILTVTGDAVGGHCLLVAGYALTGSVFPDEPGYLLRNSWGVDWGKGGNAYIRESELSALLKDDGEAALATRRSYGR